MKKLICWALAMTLALTCALPVGAVDDEEAEASPAPVTVTTAEELLEAIEAAEDGDTIFVAETCYLPEDAPLGSRAKRITLKRAESFNNNPFIRCYYPTTIENIIFDGGDGYTDTVSINADVTLSNVTIRNSGFIGAYIGEGMVTIENCVFENNRAGDGGHLWISKNASVSIADTSFNGGVAFAGSGGAIYSAGTLHLSDCTFTGNSATADGGAIYAKKGQCIVERCTITGNSANRGGGIYSNEYLRVSDTVIYGNAAALAGADIVASRSVSVTSTEELATLYQIESRDPAGFYRDETISRINGETSLTEAQSLPINSYMGTALVFAFRDELPPEESKPLQDQQEEPTQEQPEPEEPAQPSEPEASQEQEQTEESAQPLEPTQERSEEPAEAPTQEPEPEPEPEQPSASTVPPTVVPPSYAPSRSYTRSSEDSDTSEPAPAPAKQPEPEAAAPALSCGGAALDTSGRAFLAGYGDGVIGEDDPVTRAQIAQIIYRLLTDESRETLQTTENSFEDVPAEAWYNLAVSTIARAGIVIGCGDGFHPEGYITRAQLITIMARFVAPADQGSSYADVTGHWAESFIGTAEAAGWLTGGGDLHPNEYISRCEVVEFINHVFDLCEGAA